MTDLLLLKHGKHTVHKMRTSVETKGFQWCFFFLSLCMLIIFSAMVFMK